ncbi:hypothetical protein RFI_13642 [Reticulomyxa filosa]|uniref:Uncharacterized protein n=1 Tax=Reticulomyxa filosa TaxID=46433 RepID=X6NCB3_RETFI|nr:hypothetical protein RFI_13642 [Reticulomyxa filosa]|eukprot:ETO23543.1 hypothetical protein RFI_13642 [Reticulomyxa filosa]
MTRVFNSEKSVWWKPILTHLFLQFPKFCKKKTNKKSKQQNKKSNQNFQADRDTESVLAIILSRVNKSFKIELGIEITTQARLEFVENLCSYCQKNGKEIKDCKPDYYATHFLFDQLSQLEKVMCLQRKPKHFFWEKNKNFLKYQFFK